MGNYLRSIEARFEKKVKMSRHCHEEVAPSICFMHYMSFHMHYHNGFMHYHNGFWKLEYLSVFLRKFDSLITSIFFLLVRCHMIFVESTVKFLGALPLFFSSYVFLHHTSLFIDEIGSHHVSKIERGYFCLLGRPFNFDNCSYLCLQR